MANGTLKCFGNDVGGINGFEWLFWCIGIDVDEMIEGVTRDETIIRSIKHRMFNSMWKHLYRFLKNEEKLIEQGSLNSYGNKFSLKQIDRRRFPRKIESKRTNSIDTKSFNNGCCVCWNEMTTNFSSSPLLPSFFFRSWCFFIRKKKKRKKIN